MAEQKAHTISEFWEAVSKLAAKREQIPEKRRIMSGISRPPQKGVLGKAKKG